MDADAWLQPFNYTCLHATWATFGQTELNRICFDTETSGTPGGSSNEIRDESRFSYMDFSTIERIRDVFCSFPRLYRFPCSTLTVDT